MDLPKNESYEWIKFFPNLTKDDNYYNNSLSYIKQLTTIAVSCIAYAVLPRNCFTEETFEGIKLRILKTKSNNKASQFLSAALVDAYDALDKGYLHKLALCFYEDECKIGKLKESHVFEYMYTDGRVSMNLLQKTQDTSRNTNNTFENIRQQTLDFFNRVGLTLMGFRKDILPTPYGLSVRLYYNKAAPEDYHAPGFIPEEGQDHLENISLEKHSVGRIQTEFNQLGLLSYLKFRESQGPSAIMQNPPLLSQHAEKLTKTLMKNAAPVNQAQIECPCGDHLNNDNCTDDEFLTCHYCNKRQHAVCFGVFGDATSVSRHCCADCFDADKTRSPTDLTLAPLQHRQRVSLCVLRWALKFCSQVQSVDARALSERFHNSSRGASKLMKELHRQLVIPQDPEINSYKAQNIEENNLKLALNKFSNKKRDNVADRLIDEIEEVLSQESYKSNNPVEEVLTPLEKDDLRNTSHLGVIKEKPVEMSVAEDPALNQYRQALSIDEVEDSLPTACVWRKEHVKSMPTRAASSDAGNKKSRLQLNKKKPK